MIENPELWIEADRIAKIADVRQQPLVDSEVQGEQGTDAGQGDD